MWLYDALSMFEAPELHERLSPEESIERLPLLQQHDLLGSYVYSDAYMDDDRLVLETLRSAVKLGAVALNYVRAEQGEFVQGKLAAVNCTDAVSGKKIRLRGRHFISSVGPWTDQFGSKLFNDWRRMLRPSKGVHLTFDRKRLPLQQAVVMAADQQKRIVFGIPRHEMIIIGTTDTDYPFDPYDVSTTAEDVRYLLNVAREYFPGAQLTADDILASYAGVRPLVDDGSETESKTSREHVIWRDPRNVTFVTGGKYTTYRRMAEQTVEAALESFSTEDQVRFGRNDTKRPLNASATVEKMDDMVLRINELVNETDLPAHLIEMLIGRHAGEAQSLLEQLDQRPGKTPDEKIWGAEARFAIQQTMCMHLVDFYARRTPLFLARMDHGLSLLQHLSQVFAAELNWDDQRRQEEVAAVQSYVRHELAWKQML
jgi:glycerol-3-phosphate dehydrogenase